MKFFIPKPKTAVIQHKFFPLSKILFPHYRFILYLCKIFA